MKYRIEWEANDIKGGVRVQQRKPGAQLCMIVCKLGALGNQYALLTVDDGTLSTELMDKFDLVKYLNDGNYVPEDIVKQYGTLPA